MAWSLILAAEPSSGNERFTSRTIFVHGRWDLEPFGRLLLSF